MRVLLLLLLQQPPSLMALSQDILPSLPILVMANSLLLLHHRGLYLLTRIKIAKFHNKLLFLNALSLCLPSVTMLTANQLATAKIATHSQQHMDSNSLGTRPSRQVTASSREATSSRRSSRLLLLTLPRPLVPMGSPQPASTASKVDHRVTSPPITVSFASQFYSCFKPSWIKLSFSSV